ncbi:MAG: hypothetical protein COA47_17435 [Robiginitomaculum sp.]|nr:MAG: hypothetical protein COA47_17435 [Robiginitomaculum sp.]
MQCTDQPDKTDLVEIHDDKILTNSLIIAARFGKRHDNILRDIRQIDCSDNFTALNFEAVDYLDPTGRKLPMYEISRDGAMFLIMGFTGREAARWKEKFIAAFNAAERHISHSDPSVDALGAELVSLRPGWREIHDLTRAGKTIDQIADVMPMSRSSIGRARQRMHDLGIMDRAPFYRIKEIEMLLARNSLRLVRGGRYDK